MTHPLAIVLALICFSLVVSLITGFFINSFWFRYILFLVIVGGILVVFIYITRVASNEKFLFKYNFIYSIIFFFIIIFPLYFFLKNYFKRRDLNLISYENIINKFIIFPYCSIIALIIVYLLVTLIVVVKITQLNIGPLRQKY